MSYRQAHRRSDLLYNDNRYLSVADAASTYETIIHSSSTYETIVHTRGEVNVAYASTIAIDAGAAKIHNVTISGSVYFDEPLRPSSGLAIILRLTQGQASSTATWNGVFRFPDDIGTPVLSVTASVSDQLGFLYNGPAGKWDLVGFVKGY